VIVIVTGGRNYKNEHLVRRVLKTLNPDIVLFGDATGADEFAEKWSKDHRPNKHKRFDTDWDSYGRSAGPIRNREMIDYALSLDPWPLVVAFPGGRGTADCVRQAHDERFVVLRVDESLT
jgi:hypothetical protein